MFFEIFEDLRFLKIFRPKSQKSKNIPRGVECSAEPKILEIAKLGLRECFSTPGYRFRPLFHFLRNFEKKNSKNF